jgi:NADH:ubiquinone oxidoreductase subunit H
MVLLRWLMALLFGLGLVVGLLIFTAAFTLVERKLMGLHQRREGPDRVGFEGVGQPFADGLKLLRKETLRPKDTPEGRVFLVAPLLSLWVSLLLWTFLPLSAAGALFNGEVGLLLVLGLSSLGSYGVIYAGWASNNKYALLGAFRAVAQFISYEILFSLLFLPLIAATASVSLGGVASYQAVEGWFAYLVPLWLLSFLVVLAETNRTPFDLPEAEAELVAGFNVEYSSLLFAFFFLAEYSGMGFFGGLLATLFFGGWSLRPWGGTPSPFPSLPSSPPLPEWVGEWGRVVGEGWGRGVASLPSLPELVGGGGVVALKIQLLCTAFILVRAALPRHRFDQLIQLCWKYLFPLVLALVVVVVGVQYSALLGSLALPVGDGTPPPSAVSLSAEAEKAMEEYFRCFRKISDRCMKEGATQLELDRWMRECLAEGRKENTPPTSTPATTRPSLRVERSGFSYLPRELRLYGFASDQAYRECLQRMVASTGDFDFHRCMAEFSSGKGGGGATPPPVGGGATPPPVGGGPVLRSDR